MSEHDHTPEAASQPPTPHGGASGPETPVQAVSGDDSGQERALARDVAALVATVDQHSAELDGLNVVLLATVFMLGALAGIVFLQGRHLKELSDALPG